MNFFSAVTLAEGLTDSVESVPPLCQNLDQVLLLLGSQPVSDIPAAEYNLAIILFIVSIGTAVLVSFCCSLCEAAFLSLSPGQVEDIYEKYPLRGSIWRKYKARIEKPISVILILNTSAHTIGATVAGAQIDILFGNEYLTAFSLIFTWVVLQYTEILPKSLGVQFNLAVATAMTYPMQALIWLFTPLVVLINFFNRPFEVKRENESQTTLEELEALVGLAQKSNEIDPNQTRILIGATHLQQITASEVMVPNWQITYISTSQTLIEAILTAHIDPHTRFPVINGEDVNDILGYVNFKEMVALAKFNPDAKDFSQLFRKVHFVTPDEEVSDLLPLFVDRKVHAHMAIVQDPETKETLGLITLEDIVEELVGDLNDELDGNFNEGKLSGDRADRPTSLPRFFNDLPEDVLIIGGGVPLSTVITKLNESGVGKSWNEEFPQNLSISSWMVAQFGHVPHSQEILSINGWDFYVRRVRQNQIFDVLVLPEGKKGPLGIV